jgi:PKD repeat protein
VDNGVYTVTLTVTDDDGGVGVNTLEVTVNNVAPTVDAGPDVSGYVNVMVTFTGDTSDVGIYDVLTYAWAFGDGATESGTDLIDPTHTYATAGEYTVTLTVTDQDGASDSDTTTATIAKPANVPPVADAGPDVEALLGDEVTFDGSDTYDPNGDDVLTYVWDFGDDTTASGDDLTAPTHTYAAVGEYAVILTVTDQDGASDSDTTTATITVFVNSPPVADAGPDLDAKKGVEVTFDGSGTHDPDAGDTLTYAWAFGDGATESGTDLIDPTHTYAAVGEYIVALTVTDQDGASSTDTATVMVTEANTPRDIKRQAIELLLSSKTGIADLDRTIDAVIYLINKSLTPSYWIDDSHLNDKHGIKVFIYEGLASGSLELNAQLYEKSIPTLQKLIAKMAKQGKDTTTQTARLEAMQSLIPVFEEAAAMLAEADEGLAKTALDEANALTPPKNGSSFATALKNAEKEYNDGLSDEAAGNPTKAIEDFKQSWIHSRQAAHIQ